MMYPLAQWVELTSVKMVRLRWAGSSSPRPMISTVILQNSLRVRVPWGRKAPPPVPFTTPSRRSISAALAWSGSVMSVKAELPAAEAEGTTSILTSSATASRAESQVLFFMISLL